MRPKRFLPCSILRTLYPYGLPFTLQRNELVKSNVRYGGHLGSPWKSMVFKVQAVLKVHLWSHSSIIRDGLGLYRGAWH